MCTGQLKLAETAPTHTHIVGTTKLGTSGILLLEPVLRAASATSPARVPCRIPTYKRVRGVGSRRARCNGGPREGFLLPQKNFVAEEESVDVDLGRNKGGRGGKLRYYGRQPRKDTACCHATRRAFKLGSLPGVGKSVALMALRPPAAFSLSPRPWIGLLLIRLAHLRCFIRRYVSQNSTTQQTIPARARPPAQTYL